MDPARAAAAAAIVEEAAPRESYRDAAELIHRIFARLREDSAAGCALSLSLGLNDGLSLEKLGKRHGCTKQFIHALRNEFAAKLGLELTVLLRQAPARPPARPSPADDQAADAASDLAGDDLDRLVDELSADDVDPADVEPADEDRPDADDFEN